MLPSQTRPQEKDAQVQPSNAGLSREKVSINNAIAELHAAGAAQSRPPCFCCSAAAIKWTHFGPSCAFCYDELSKAARNLALPSTITANSIFAPALTEMLATTNPAAITILAAYFELATRAIIAPETPRAMLGLPPLK